MKDDPGIMNNSAKKGFIMKELGKGHLLLDFSGTWSIYGPPPSFDKVLFAQYSSPVNRITIETNGLDAWDSSLIVWLKECRTYCNEEGIIFENDRLPENLKKLLLFGSVPPPTITEQAIGSEEETSVFLEEIKNRILSAIKPLNHFIKELKLSFIRLIKGQAQWRWRDFLLMLQTCGVAALPIITLISVLIGMIMAFLGAVVLKQFGAEIYISNLIGWGVLREMGVL